MNTFRPWNSNSVAFHTEITSIATSSHANGSRCVLRLIPFHVKPITLSPPTEALPFAWKNSSASCLSTWSTTFYPFVTAGILAAARKMGENSLESERRRHRHPNRPDIFSVNIRRSIGKNVSEGFYRLVGTNDGRFRSGVSSHATLSFSLSLSSSG